MKHLKQLKRILGIIGLVVIGAILGGVINRAVYAQSNITTFQITPGTATHTSCVLTPSTTSFCFASDGLWQSLGGAAFVQLGVAAPAGVISLTVCNAAGASCGSAQTGAVSLNIPKTATVSAPTATLQ